MRGGLVVGEAPVPRAHRVTSDWMRDFPLWGVAALIGTLIWRGQDILHIPGFAQPVWGTLVLAIGTVAVGRQAWERIDPLRNPVARALIAFAVIALLGVATSLAPRASGSYFLKHFIPSLLLAWTAASAVRRARDAEWLVAATALGAAAFSLHAIAVGYSGQDGRWTGFAYYDPNDLALHLVAVTPLAAYFFRRGSTNFKRLVAAGALGLYLMAIMKTESRGGLIGLVAVGGYMVVFFSAIPRRVRVTGLVVGVLGVSALATGRYWSRIQTVLQPKGDYNLDRNDPTGRLQLWKRGLGYAASRPVLGVGLNAYIVAERELSPIARERRMQGRSLNFLLIAHNTLVQIAAELGFVALGVFLYMLWRARGGLRRVLLVRRSVGADAADQAAALAHALTASLLGFVVCGLFLSAPYFPLLYLLMGLIVGLERTEAPVAASVPDAAPVARGGIATDVGGRGGLVVGDVAPARGAHAPAGRGGAAW